MSNRKEPMLTPRATAQCVMAGRNRQAASAAGARGTATCVPGGSHITTMDNRDGDQYGGWIGKDDEAQRFSVATTTKGPAARFRLEFDDGTAVLVRGRGLIGRDPTATAGADVKHLITLSDDTRSLSRTHLEFDLGVDGIWVRDCGSTNGSEIEFNGRRMALGPGHLAEAPSGCTIQMGVRQVKVRRIAGRAVIGRASVDWGVATHIGAMHERSEDAYCAAPPVFVVADGMGGHYAGDIASREAVEAMMPLADMVPVTGDMLMTCLAEARSRIGRIPVDSLPPPGTTLSGVVVTEVDEVPTWLVVNIGDSRTYRLNSDGFRQLSVDHSIVQQLIDAGTIDASAARSLPFRNVLTRALLADTEHPADVGQLPMMAGDRILACSDGVTRELDDTAIANMLRAIRDPLAAASELVRAATDAGGHDDMTALVIDASGSAPSEATQRLSDSSVPGAYRRRRHADAAARR